MPVLSLGERLYAAPRPGTVLCCPSCGSEDVGSVDVVLASCDGLWGIDEFGAVEFVPAGDTEVCWDSQESVDDEPCECGGCGWRGEPHMLVTAERFDELKAIALKDAFPWKMCDPAVHSRTDGQATAEPGEHDWSGAFCSMCGADEASSFASKPCPGLPF